MENHIKRYYWYPCTNGILKKLIENVYHIKAMCRFQILLHQNKLIFYFQKDHFIFIWNVELHKEKEERKGRERQGKRKRERKRERGYITIDFYHTHNGQHWGRLMPEAWNSIWVSHIGGSGLGTLARNWIGRNLWDLNCIHLGCYVTGKAVPYHWSLTRVVSTNSFPFDKPSPCCFWSFIFFNT